MALCPKCYKHFRVMEDEDPRDFGCPRCGYGDPNEREEGKEPYRKGPEGDYEDDVDWCAYCGTQPVEVDSDFCSDQCRIDSEEDR